MALQDKYSKLIAYAQSANVSNLSVVDNGDVLNISGTASQSVNDQLWDIYNQIDPDMSSGDLVLSIDVVPGSEEIYEIKSGDSLSKIAAKYPGMTWQKIFDANKDTIKDPNMIYPGQKINIPV